MKTIMEYWWWLMQNNLPNAPRNTKTKHFALLDWVEQDLLLLHSIDSHENTADAMMKILTQKTFYRYYNTYMGLCRPYYTLTDIGSSDKHPPYSSNALSTKHGIVKYGNWRRNQLIKPQVKVSHILLTTSHNLQLLAVRSMGGYSTYLGKYIIYLTHSLS